MLHSDSPKRQQTLRSVRLKTAYLFQLAPNLSEDEVDRLPSCIRIGWFDLLCHVFSIGTYLSDMGLDLWVAVVHYRRERFLAALLTLVFVAVPSLIINIISLFWWLDDRLHRTGRHDETDYTDNLILRERLQRLTRFKKAKKLKNKNIEVTETDVAPELKESRGEMVRWVMYTVFQVAPLVWHFRALKAAYFCMQLQRLPRRERTLFHRLYFKMIEAERDASVLRFFEALLESLPQLLIQGYFLLDDLVKSDDLEAFDWKLRSFSMAVSLLCISFSFVSHHRTLRISLPDKQNLNILECNLILAWRFFSILGRFVFLSLLIYFHHIAAACLLFVHTLASAAHLTINQRIQTGSSFDFLDKLMILINVWIHTFAPFNMSTGRSRMRYLVGYGLEVAEKMAIICILHFFTLQQPGIVLIQKTGIIIWTPVVYFFGLLLMMIYFACAHPTLFLISEIDLKDEASGGYM